MNCERNQNEYDCPLYCRPKCTYTGRVACCPLVSHVEYAPRALLRLENRWDRQTDRQTDGRTEARLLHYVYSLPLDAVSVTLFSQLNIIDDGAYYSDCRREGGSSKPNEPFVSASE